MKPVKMTFSDDLELDFEPIKHKSDVERVFQQSAQQMDDRITYLTVTGDPNYMIVSNEVISKFMNRNGL